MLRAGLCLLVLLGAGAPFVRNVPAQAQEKPVAGQPVVEICDGLLSGDPSQRDRAALELNLLAAKRAEELGREILRRPVIEARRLLESVGEATGDFSIVAAIVALESEEQEIRTAAFEAMVEAPVKALRNSGTDYLKNKRRSNLLSILASKDALKPVCEGVEESDGIPKTPVHTGLHLAILADCYFGAKGLTGVLRALGELMIGEDTEAAPGEQNEQEVRAQRERLRRQSAAMFEAVWVAAPGSQFNYVANAPIEERRKAVARMNARLTEMENREVESGAGTYKGVRLGEYMMGLFGSDVSETVAAAYLRMQWWKGDDVPIDGENYGAHVERINAMGRRDRMALRAELKRWWETYRSETEAK